MPKAMISACCGDAPPNVGFWKYAAPACMVG
jgi:hypothetical protein